MERALARLAAAASGASARDGAGIVLYEDAARRRVTALAGALRALRTLSDVAEEVKGAQQTQLYHVATVDVLSRLKGNPQFQCTSQAGCVRVTMAHIRQGCQGSCKPFSKCYPCFGCRSLAAGG